MSNCKKNSDKIRILSNCQKPVYINMCNTDVLASAIANAIGTGGASVDLTTLNSTVGVDCNNNPALRVITECDECNTYTYTGTTNATVTGTDIVVTVENGTLTYNANSSGTVQLSTANVHGNGINQVRSETMNGTVEITVSSGTIYNVHYTSCSGQALTAAAAPSIDVRNNGNVTLSGTTTGVTAGDVVNVTATFESWYGHDDVTEYITLTVPATVQSDGSFVVADDAIISDATYLYENGTTAQDTFTVWDEDNYEYYTVTEGTTPYSEVSNRFPLIANATFPTTATLASDPSVQDVDTSINEVD